MKELVLKAKATKEGAIHLDIANLEPEKEFEVRVSLLGGETGEVPDLARYQLPAKPLSFRTDPVEEQDRIRAEWDR